MEYRRNKPQQELYKPGSGPLRRSSYVLDAKMDNAENIQRSRDHGHYGSRNSINNDDINNYPRDQGNTRRRKPEQQLYVPRSGDLSSESERYSKSGRSDNSSQFNRKMSGVEPCAQDKPYNGSGSYSRAGSRRDRSKNDTRYKDGTDNNYKYRQSRQMSETRSISPSQCTQEQNISDRIRDSRSMETSATRHTSNAGGKPPSGRRNSAGFTSDSSRYKYMLNLDNIPPRFRKKFLEQSGQSLENMDTIHRDRHYSNNSLPMNYDHTQNMYSSNPNWSQTLPSRGRGRLKDADNFDKEKFINSFLKSYEVQTSGRSTPSNSYSNLCEPNIAEIKSITENIDSLTNCNESKKDYSETVLKNGLHHEENETYNDQEHQKSESDNQNDSEDISHISSTLMDMTNLDWTEEVEKNIKLDDMCETTTSFSQNVKPNVSQDVKLTEAQEPKKRSRRRDGRISSRGNRNSEKKTERNRKDSNVSVKPEPERSRKDSNVSLQHEAVSASLRRRDRERRDSHRSNRSSNIGNSRDDLDRWRSLRSYSREQSTEGRIVSQCNSRDGSVNRAMSPRDGDGFKVPSAAAKSAAWLSTTQKKGRTPSADRGRHSPTPSHVSGGTETGEAGGGRRSRKKPGSRRRRHAEPVSTPPGATPAPNNVNWREEILESKKHSHDKQGETHQRNRNNNSISEKSVSESSTSHPGLIILPQGSMTHMQKDQGRGGSVENQKTLYDHQNPSKPIIVQTSPTKVDMRMERGVKECSVRGACYEAGDASRAARHRELLQEVDRADAILQTHTLRGPLALAAHWHDVTDTRKFLQNALQKLLMLDLKYCQADNVEHNFWKILYYNFIEILRRSFTQVAPEDKPKIVSLINTIIEEGNTFFEHLIQMLEKAYKFNTDDYLNDNHVLPPKGKGYVGLALISVQKLYVFLGDLARYKEQVNETNNYAKSKSWYTKAQQINPKNGRPYNQLAILAIYARRKLDAVYYYMRSLMSSNPFHSARESLLSLFDENRKKYEVAERKRKAALESRNGENNDSASNPGQSLRREVWVRPSGHRTTTLRHDTRDEHLTAMTSVELNKHFITSYLHVHGKIITKIGMETFRESASQMLRQFRELLHRQPLPTPAVRLLQLTALNMFAVETTTKDKSGSRSPWLESALSVSLLMFGALLERCCALLPEPPHTQQHADALLLLPAIKVWCDWMLCHSSVWNPPPTFDNFDIDSDSDPWDWLAKLMNILEALDDKSIVLESETKEGYVPVRLAEDASLAGFTPLMYMEPAAACARADQPHHAAEHSLRTRKLLFFGTEYLVGVEPPVLRLEYPADAPPRYVSAVQRAPASNAPLQHLSEDSEDDLEAEVAADPASLEGLGGEGPDEATKKLLRRKEQLESRKATMERRNQRMQEILRGGWVSVEVEVRPKWLVPDTNCFIDHLSLLRAIALAPGQPYVLAVPIVVMTELEGLRRCGRVGASAAAALAWVQSEGAGAAGVRLATARGSLLASRAFTAEADEPRASNDDRVLATALSLHDNFSQPEAPAEVGGASACPRRVREVVLLTEDRNLRVKAMAAELPTRDLPSFVNWAHLAADDTNAQTETGSDKPKNK